jgi:phosphate-selective porin OprO and OprP
MRVYNSRVRRSAAAGIGMILSAISVGARADEQPAKTLEQRFEEQEQRIKILERKLELQAEAAATTAAAKDTPQVKASPKGFSLETKDGQNVFKLRGLLQVDGRYFTDDVAPQSADTFLLRRVRPIFEGTLGGIYDFRFTPDFAGGKTVIQDAYIAARFKPWFTVTAGKFKAPFGLERLQGGGDIKFIERAFPTTLAPNRDIGVQFSGGVLQGRLNYAVGFFNGALDGASSESNTSPDVDNNRDKDIVARIFATPFINSDIFALRGLGFGIAWSHSIDSGADVTATATNTLLPTYRTDGQQTFFSYRTGTIAGSPDGYTLSNGKHDRIGPQFYYYTGPFGLIGEYTKVTQELRRSRDTGTGTVTRTGKLSNDAWQLAASWLLTGEDASFRSVTPSRSYGVNQPGWGAFELVARVSELDIDDDAFAGGGGSFANPSTRASKASEWVVGLNWYLSQNFRIAANYEQTKFDGGAPNGEDRDDEKVFLTRFQVAF